MSFVTGVGLDQVADRYVSLGMYPFEPLRPAWESLWREVQHRVPSLPARLRWDVDVHEAWVDPACSVSQACGWPAATTLRDVVAVVGAFSLTIDGAEGPRYRSVLVSQVPTPLGRRDLPTTRAAVNSVDSLSGWISLGACAGEPAGWPGPVTSTGSHPASLAEVRTGRADVASIDSLTWALLRRIEPTLVDGLHVIGHGPLVPSLPIVVPASTGNVVPSLQEAFVNALDDPATQGARAALLLEGFVPLDHHDYAALLTLTTTR